ncbi:hypothetical protein HPB49_002172 [Dermacentor silvarum]|uniref:Uncharacterized protein n=1 Tax=Dermacentor silvarum TaxID=543639 RepID=A0ACB8DT13_DERSI|nr:hypothetical protein HPB49_002172 [Dermacentor silvarum]
MLMNIRQVRRRRFTRSENTYEAGASSSVPFSWNSLIRESLLQTSWPISLSADSDDDEFDFFNPRRTPGRRRATTIGRVGHDAIVEAPGLPRPARGHLLVWRHSA